MTGEAMPFPDPREAWFSPYRGMAFGQSFKWLFAGVLLYALLLLVAMAGKPEEATYPIIGPSLYLTPMFGLPYVLATLNRPGRTRRMLYFILLLPLVHIAANYLAWYYAVSNFDQLDASGDFRRNLITGAIGGLAGAVFSFALLRLVQLTPAVRSPLVMMILGTMLLTALGAWTMAAGLQWTDAVRRPYQHDRAILWYQSVHLPWQLVFALLLAWLMRKAREPEKPKRPAGPAEALASDAQAVAGRLRENISAE